MINAGEEKILRKTSGRTWGDAEIIDTVVSILIWVALFLGCNYLITIGLGALHKYVPAVPAVPWDDVSIMALGALGVARVVRMIVGWGSDKKHL